jgi:hypothetical protein
MLACGRDRALGHEFAPRSASAAADLVEENILSIDCLTREKEKGVEWRGDLSWG